MRSIITTGLGIFLLMACNQTKNDTIRPVKKDLIQAVYASGKVYPLQLAKINPKVSGYVVQLFVQPGDTVRAGQPLMKIEFQSAQLNIDNAQNNLELTTRNLQENTSLLDAASQERNSARERYRLDSANYSRLSNLWQDGIGTRQNLDQANTQQKLSAQNWRKAESNYHNLKDRLQTEYRNAKNNVGLQQINASDYWIRAPFNLRVYNINTELGQYVSPANWTFEVGDPYAFQAEIDIDESDIGWVKPGQTVLMTADALPGDTIRGVIERIYPNVIPGNKTSTAIVQMPKGKAYVAGMAIESNILVQEKKQVLVIPRAYLGPNQEVQLSGKEKRKIKVGIMDLEYVEVLDGLDTNTVLIKPR